MVLPSIAYGRVLTHLESLFASLAADLEGRGHNFSALLDRINLDPVYRSLLSFRLPVAKCQKLEDLKCQITRVEIAIHRKCEQYRERDPLQAEELGRAIRPFISSARNFFNSYSRRWDAQSYFIAPVWLTAVSGTSTPGLTFLRRHEPDIRRSAGWSLAGLTQDSELVQLNRSYFQQIANVLMGVLYFTDWQRPHADPRQLHIEHVYQLLFGCEITAGRSHGGAILAQFALAYLNSAFGSNYLNYVSPVPATVISAVVEIDGKISAIDHLEDKARCAIEEFGPELHFVLPSANRLPQDLARQLPPDHVHYVGTAEELLTAALFVGNAGRCLEDVRAALFQALSVPAREAVYASLRAGVGHGDLERRYFSGRRSAICYTNQPCGVLSRAEIEGRHVGLRLGFEEAAFSLTNAHPDLVMLVLDGSEQMEAAWKPGDQNMCRMTDLVLAVARRLHQRRQGSTPVELVCAFLSTREIMPIEPGMPADVIEAAMQRLRHEDGLRFRGAFMRPVNEEVAARFHDRTKRICVVSDGAIFDYEDAEDNLFSARTWYAFCIKDAACGRIDLCGGGSGLSPAVLDEHFAGRRDALCSVVVELGPVVPLAWDPADGELNRNKQGGMQLEFALPEAASFLARLQLPNWARPHELTIAGEMVREGRRTAFKFRDFAVAGQCKPLPVPLEGTLGEADYAAWKQFGSAQWRCPMCGLAHPHLLDRQPLELQPRPVFQSLHGNSGYFLLEAGMPKWVCFQTGYDLGPVAVVVLEGQPHWTFPDGNLQPIPSEGRHYRLEHEGRTFIVVPAL